MAVTDSWNGQPRKVPVHPWVILIVDDEPDILVSLGDLVEQSLDGVRVLRAASGREALALLLGERVDAVISDFKMAGMDGIEFLYMARQKRPSIPRVLLTAHADLELTRRASQEGGVQAFLSKAISPDEFIERVSGLLTYDPVILPAR
jgi:response regulator RpfG family c-di-GMP phosphodiesterase